ncbi:MAG: DUF3343 domain-containing protein [Firmicutes bacterium]|nr:DUF3343 domain-containing protein [Bacillota bacterium]MBR3707357.1 DUF3343 domain-containing protein [Bacillota bacterium]MBR6584694.1 DUF3343 domain-containing protein [Bacillota bacterium]
MEYIMSFSSFYKAAYARDTLEQNGISSTLKKLPPELITSCGTGLYLRTDSIQRAREVLDQKNILARGVYLIEREGKHNKRFTKLK